MLLLFCGSYILTKLIIPPYFRFLAKAHALKKNWRDIVVVNSAGTVIILVMMVFCIPFFTDPGKSRTAAGALAVLCVSLLGLLDDCCGEDKVKGIKGHLAFLLQTGKISTGILKAAGTGLITAVYIFSQQEAFSIRDWLLLVLTVNFVNLLDLRPGRALKGTALLFSAAVFLGGKGLVMLAAAGGALLAYAPYDLKGRAMLGDAGSNALGMLAGIGLLESGETAKMIVVVLLAIVHFAAEKYSFSTIIERTPILKKADEWGRK